MAIDHIESVVPVTGFDNWQAYVDRLFCSAENLQVLCKEPCHKEKSLKENAERRAFKALTKPSKKVKPPKKKKK